MSFDILILSLLSNGASLWEVSLEYIPTSRLEMLGRVSSIGLRRQ